MLLRARARAATTSGSGACGRHRHAAHACVRAGGRWRSWSRSRRSARRWRRVDSSRWGRCDVLGGAPQWCSGSRRRNPLLYSRAPSIPCSASLPCAAGVGVRLQWWWWSGRRGRRWLPSLAELHHELVDTLPVHVAPAERGCHPSRGSLPCQMYAPLSPYVFPGGRFERCHPALGVLAALPVS